MFDHLLVGSLIALALTLPLAWKWQLGMTRVAGSVLVLSCLFSMGVSRLAAVMAMSVMMRSVLVASLTVVAAVTILAYRFYRDPERTVPHGDDVVVSPADGIVAYVRSAERGILPISDKNGHQYTLTELTKTKLETDDAVVIGISMSFLDVHVNRAPIAGKISLRSHFPGLFGSLRQPEMLFANERATTVIDGERMQVAVVQIASRLVRQIVSFVRTGEQVAVGQRIGVIRLGSQVDVVLPARHDLRISVTPGQRLWAGQSVLAEFSTPEELPTVAMHAMETN